MNNRYSARLATLMLIIITFGLVSMLGLRVLAGGDDWVFLPAIANGGEPETTPTATAMPTATATRPPIDSANIIVDSRSVDAFDDIPEQYIQAAADLRMLFIDRSVGGNIHEGLTCLSYPNDEQAPFSSCRVLEHFEPSYEVDPSVIDWSRPGGYDRSNWEFQFWLSNCGNWPDKIQCFQDMVNPIIGQFDVVSFQYSYLAVMDGSTIANQPGGFFWDNSAYLDVYDFEDYVAQHSDKVFIYWTSSLARSIGNEVSVSFNEQMRQYAIDNEKVLFDVADILSHDPDGNPCYDNRDGVYYANNHDSENFPDDGQQYLAICPHYTTETEGGHLGSVAAGKIRVAKAFWVLMARIAGWDGSY